LKFLALTADATQARNLAEREVQRPQRAGTVLAELAWLRTSRVELRARLADLGLSEEDREATQDQLEVVLAAQELMDADMACDPGGYLVWFWAEGNPELLRQAQRFSQ
jgi:hypothetical protein